MSRDLDGFACPLGAAWRPCEVFGSQRPNDSVRIGKKFSARDLWSAPTVRPFQTREARC
jgi:hypothetical protein